MEQCVCPCHPSCNPSEYFIRSGSKCIFSWFHSSVLLVFHWDAKFGSSLIFLYLSALVLMCSFSLAFAFVYFSLLTLYLPFSPSVSVHFFLFFKTLIYFSFRHFIFFLFGVFPPFSPCHCLFNSSISLSTFFPFISVLLFLTFFQNSLSYLFQPFYFFSFLMCSLPPVFAFVY